MSAAAGCLNKHLSPSRDESAVNYAPGRELIA
jgi:hypothetical protein